MKRFCCIFLSFFLLYATVTPVCAVPDFGAQVAAASVCLMEASSGRILYAQNEDKALPPASVTKVMTLLLVLEAVDRGDISLGDTVRVSDYASSMGGSQVYLKAGEEMSVDDLIKSVAVASANDGAVALAEHVAGSEEAFVSLMNDRARTLGMENTVFKNTNGLDDEDTGHLTSAKDIAIMSRELLTHEKIFDYTTIWMDSIRGGAFGLTNTNRLVRFYRGCNGLKTGSTAKAGFCISATAKRGEMQLICVVMGAENKDTRNSLAASLMDWGFANYTVATAPRGEETPIAVSGGTEDTCPLIYDGFSAVIEKAEEKNVKRTVTLPPAVAAPIRAGDSVGEILFTCGDTELGRVPIRAGKDVERIGFWTLLHRVAEVFILR